MNEELPAEIVATINRDHLVATPLAPADLLFVFGTRHAVDAFVARAAELWRTGHFRWALVSGGATPGGAATEADVLARGMIAAGVPEAVILREALATNTGENVILSLPILERAIGLDRISSLIALGKAPTSVRYLMTLERHWPAVRKMLVTINTFPHPLEAWSEHPEARRKVYDEWRKIEAYRARGFIADLPQGLLSRR